MSRRDGLCSVDQRLHTKLAFDLIASFDAN